jgi:hypothetical protein
MWTTQLRLRPLVLLLLTLSLPSLGCGSDAKTTETPDTAGSADDTSVADTADGSAADTASDGSGSADGSGSGDAPEEDVVCRPCVTNEDCGGENLCINGATGETFCGQSCAGLDDASCPSGTVCLSVTADTVLFQCFPADLRCNNPCAGLVCDPGFVCDPDADGACLPPRGLCEPCTNNEQCGGAADLCLQFDDAGADRACTIDCAADATVCPEGYFCATVGTGADAPKQCVPDILTCVDRCVGVTCDATQYCDPRTGGCKAQGAACDPCSLDFECGGDADLCIALPGPDCADNTDCPAGDFCRDGSCVMARCGVDCSPDEFGTPGTCPADYNCFDLGGGLSQCLPFFLACEDLCAAVDCGEGFNCEQTTGNCIRSTSEACQACDTSASCGGQDSVCSPVVTGGPAICLPGCDESRPCGIGYNCLFVSTTLRACLPANATFDCGSCDVLACPDGQTCSPISERCEDNPVACTDASPVCDGGEICRGSEFRCEPIGSACDFESRFSSCGFGTTVCTAGAAGRDGGCEQDCSSDAECPDDRPFCVTYKGLIFGMCTDTPEGAADVCGRLGRATDAVTGSPLRIGQPCEGDASLDPSVCGGDPGLTCILPDPSAEPLCTTTCTQDSDCAPFRAHCASVGGANFCLPAACDCAGAPPIGAREDDIFGDAVTAAGVTRCTLGWTLAERRASLPFYEVHDAYRLAKTAALSGEPARAQALLEAEKRSLAALTVQQPQVAIRTAATIFGVTYGSAPLPPAGGDATPLATAISQLLVAAGAPADATLPAAVAAVPLDVQRAAARYVSVAAVVVAQQRALFGGATGPLLAAATEGLHTAFLDGNTTVDPFAPALVDAVRTSRILSTLHAGADSVARLTAESNFVFAGDLAAVSFSYTTPLGSIIIGGSGNDTYELDTPTLLLLELGGDDTYYGAVGANAGSAQPVAIALDLSGSDTYTYREVAVADDAGLLPSDGAGRAAPTRGGNGPTSLSTVGRQGAGRGGIGILYDLGPGTDSYRSLRFGQGFGLLGVGMLIDEQGDATLDIEAAGQGAGFFGTGILVLGDTSNNLTGYHAVQGFGGPYGVGILLGGRGDDLYTALPGDPLAGDALYRERLGGPDAAYSAAQGAATGYLATATRAQASGGVGLLVERGGNDSYLAGLGAQGYGRTYGVGQLFEAGGVDRYSASGFADGAGIDSGHGLLQDEAGDDFYGSALLAAESSLGFGTNFGGGICYDRAGNDTYFGGFNAFGAGTLNGLGLFAEVAGNDGYTSESNDTFGKAALTVAGSSPDTNPRRQVGTFALFAEGGGSDRYTRPDGLAGPLGDGRTWSQTVAAERGLAVHAGGNDGVGPLLFAPESSRE